MNTIGEFLMTLKAVNKPALALGIVLSLAVSQPALAKSHKSHKPLTRKHHQPELDALAQDFKDGNIHKYKGRHYTVSGVIFRKDESRGSILFVTNILEGEGLPAHWRVSCNFDDKTQVYGLTVGSAITVTGDVNTDDPGPLVVNIDHCHLVN